ncbi:leucine-rich repeat-containing protein 70 [Tetranychus urticae]|uniref:Uncharacterized protein n=1 Tax=Tetranychus urticae TaxID=32264 RepID=T1K3Y9_TETUR|nr:leucine-rich repeat-containing protein 70 [Tetranychus urticae]
MISEISTLCLFSLLCFGKQRIKPTNATQCEEYTYLGDKISLNCNSGSLLQPYKDLKIHALAINGTPSDHQQTLADVNFNHLIIQNANFIGPTEKLSTPETVIGHESLTIVRSSSIALWSWAEFNFKHIYFEDCLLNSIDDKSSFKVVTNQFLPNTLKSLSMINCRIFSIGQGALGFLNSIQTLTITHNHLTTFSRLALPSEAPNLWSIDLSNNKLESLADYFTHNLPSLKELNLRNNQLLVLPTNFFNPMLSLSMIDLEDNALNCDQFCWIFTDVSAPRPMLLDSTSCIMPNKQSVILAWSSSDSIGCTNNRAKRCANDTSTVND